MKNAQSRVMEVMKELVTVQGQVEMCKKRLEIHNTYEELDHKFCLVNLVPICPCHAPVQSPLVKPPSVIRAIAPLQLCARGLVEMPLLQDADLDCYCITGCYRCKAVGHMVSQCSKKRRNRKGTVCGSTHKVAKCPAKACTTSPVSPPLNSDTSKGSKP